MRLCVRDFRGDNVQLGEPRFVRRAMTEIAVHGRNETLLVIRDKLAQARQAVAAHGKRRKSLVRESPALQLERSRERLARLRRGDRRVHLVIIASALCDYRASKEARQSKNGRYARASRY